MAKSDWVLAGASSRSRRRNKAQISPLYLSIADLDQKGCDQVVLLPLRHHEARPSVVAAELGHFSPDPGAIATDRVQLGADVVEELPFAADGAEDPLGLVVKIVGEERLQAIG